MSLARMLKSMSGSGQSASRANCAVYLLLTYGVNVRLRVDLPDTLLA